MIRRHGLVGKLDPLPAWETVPPGDVFRAFERGGRLINPQFPEIGNPNATGELQRLDEPGRPDIRQSNRGLATGLRVSEKNWVRFSLVCRSLRERLFQKAQ